MEIKYFIPLVLEVKINGEVDRILEREINTQAYQEINVDSLIRKKIRRRINEFLIYWVQTNGVEVTARFIK